jgi:hypothetical protein
MEPAFGIDQSKNASPPLLFLKFVVRGIGSSEETHIFNILEKSNHCQAEP